MLHAVAEGGGSDTCSSMVKMSRHYFVIQMQLRLNAQSQTDKEKEKEKKTLICIFFMRFSLRVRGRGRGKMFKEKGGKNLIKERKKEE